MNYTNTLQSFAYNQHGQLTSIREAERGQSCLCTCPVCGEKLIAKQGEIRAWHFAHTSGNECENAGESSLHLACKEVVARASMIVKPCLGDDLQYLKIHKAHMEIPVKTEDGLTIVPDVTICSSNDELTFIEIAVTHKIDTEKKEKIDSLKIPTMEIVIDSSMMEEWDWKTIEELVLHDNLRRYWIYEPQSEVIEKTDSVVNKGSNSSAYTNEFQTKINDVPVRVRQFDWGVSVWSGFDTEVNLQIKKIMRGFGGRWNPRYKNWTVAGSMLFEPMIEALEQTKFTVS